ncbi:hypothetical protein [Sphingomonas aerolata]|uniref:hypothetical protein n=1 Tax=Sphingomonas aerolata TaxID=185951 RepID=UPI002FE22258
MTEVLNRGDPPVTPVMHAFVIGCGRFPAKPSLDRAATVSGARRMMEFLASHADEFVAPIWTIECLLSDPAVAPGKDTLGCTLADPGPQGSAISAAGTPVEPVRLRTLGPTGDLWLDKIRPGDHAFFYMSSHGIADGADALGLCEDVLSNPRRLWSQSLNVSTLAPGLTSAIGKAACAWVFLDACQEVVPALLGSPTGLPGIYLLEYDLATALKAADSFGLVGARMGGKAWAPKEDEPPFFTQALLESFGSGCVEPVPDLGWAVTASRLLSDIPLVAEVALGRKGLEVEALTRSPKAHLGLIKVPMPMIPIALSTEVEAHLTQAKVTVVCDDEAVERHEREPGGEDVVWRFKVEAHRKRSYSAKAVFPDGTPVYSPGQFDPNPPAQVVKLRRVV